MTAEPAQPQATSALEQSGLADAEPAARQEDKDPDAPPSRPISRRSQA